MTRGNLCYAYLKRENVKKYKCYGTISSYKIIEVNYYLVLDCLADSIEISQLLRLIQNTTIDKFYLELLCMRFGKIEIA
jgi:hypothetical protein